MTVQVPSLWSVTNCCAGPQPRFILSAHPASSIVSAYVHTFFHPLSSNHVNIPVYWWRDLRFAGWILKSFQERQIMQLPSIA